MCKVLNYSSYFIFFFLLVVSVSSDNFIDWQGKPVVGCIVGPFYGKISLCLFK